MSYLSAVLDIITLTYSSLRRLDLSANAEVILDGHVDCVVSDDIIFIVAA